jgi:hypothetical protein
MWSNQTMTRLVLDPDLRAKLHNLTEPLELCDESGQILAHLTPAIRPPHSETIEPRISRDELLRRKQNKSHTSTTAEVLAYLETL